MFFYAMHQPTHHTNQQAYRPREIHMLTEYTKVLSQRMVKNAKAELLPNAITL